MLALENTMREFNGDDARVDLTGLSTGGYGSWYLATEHLNRFAAVVPVCGGIMPSPNATSVRHRISRVCSKSTSTGRLVEPALMGLALLSW